MIPTPASKVCTSYYLGTEHVDLALYAVGGLRLVCWKTLGVSRDVFEAQLDEERGTAQAGKFHSPRAIAILAMADAKAAELGGTLVSPERIFARRHWRI